MVHDTIRPRGCLCVLRDPPTENTARMTDNLSTGECVGYIGRTLSSLENPGPYELGPFVMQSVLLLVSPALLAASIYMMLGRIVLM